MTPTERDNLNQRFAKLCGIPCHSWETKGIDGKTYVHTDPDFCADPRLVLREMMKREDWKNFHRTLVGAMIWDEEREIYGIFAIAVDYILDETGLLCKAACDFMEKEEGNG